MATAHRELLLRGIESILTQPNHPMIATAIAFGAGALVGTAGIYAGYKLGFEHGFKQGYNEARPSVDSINMLSNLAGALGSGFSPFAKPDQDPAEEETPD